MKKLLLLILFSAVVVSGQTRGPDNAWKSVDDAMGRSGQAQPDGAHKFSMPRSDLKVTLDGVELKAGFALGSWAAFRKMGNQAEVMGDLVLMETEIGPVMQKLTESGIEVTGLHNHLIGESPHVMYMHIEGKGDAVKLAGALHDALALTKTPPPSPPPANPPQLSFDSKQVDTIMGRSGKNNNGVYQFAIARAEKVVESGMDALSSMGLATSLNFQPTGAGKAAITGDFVLIAREVNPVIKTLRQNGIAVTALHSHMLDEQPRLFFMHFWANDDATKLAKGLRAAIDQTNVVK